MVKKRSFLGTFVQLIAALAGIVALIYLVALYIPASKVFFTDEANLGEVLATVLAFIPLSFIIGPVCMICGFVDLIVSIKQRKSEETKDIFSLIFLIIGIILIVIPFIMILSMIIASNAKNTEAIRLII